MKKKIIFIFLLISIFTVFKNSYASQQGRVYLQSNYNIIENGKEIEITVNLENAKTAAYNFNFYYDDLKVELIDYPENVTVSGNEIMCVWYDGNGGSGAKDGELQKFIFKAKEEGIATFTIEGEFWNQETELINMEFANIQIQIGKTDEVIKETEEPNTNLETLAIQGALLYPPFDINETKYKTEISNNIQNINILAIPEDEKATVQIIGKENLKEGENLITIVVTSSDKISKKVYEVLVYRRNLEEEQAYETEIIENKKKLENAYKIEKLSLETTEENKTQTPKENEKNAKIMLIVIVILIIVLLIYIAFIKLR